MRKETTKVLGKVFFNRPADLVAKNLLGCFLCIKRKGKIEKYQIIETEAYVGPEDLASHASKGRTARTEVMFDEAGTIYVYLIYGMYDMLNIVTGPKDFPSAVLIRGIEGYNGPGKLTKALGISRKLNGKVLGLETGVWIEEPKDHQEQKRKITKTPRIGVSYAGIWAKKKLRFVLSK